MKDCLNVSSDGQKAAGKWESGQGLVEAALTIPVFILIAVAIFFIGNTLRTASALNSAAAAGALHASLGYETGSPAQPCDDGDPGTLTVLELVCSTLEQQMVSPAEVEITVEWCGKGKAAGNPDLTVCITEGIPAYGDVFYVRLRRDMCYGTGYWGACIPVRSQAAAIVQRELVD